MEASTAPEAEPTIEKDVFHKIKTIQFLGRKAPIILQEANGPCPLVAICNVLSLKNRLHLSPDVVEVSQKKLISLVAQHLTNSNIDIEEQNIADALDLLHRLPTGIELDIKFRRSCVADELDIFISCIFIIDDFAFTRECAMFDSLDISLYHGWIVDPQDHETAEAIGSKSFNALMEELVALDAVNIENGEYEDTKANVADSKSPHRTRKGDIEEAAELLRVLKLSEEMYYSSEHIIEPKEKYDDVLSPDSRNVNGILKPVRVVDGREGEEFVLGSVCALDEVQVLLAEEVDRDEADNIDLTNKCKISMSKGEVIKNFMRNSCSQLTVCGLASLKEQVKEREACVLFRNNHLNTMFKYECELYLLVANEGYMDQPDLVWEKLNEVNGDTRYMTGNFKEFKMDDHSNRTLNATNSTEDSLGSTDKAAHEGPIIDVDLEVALAFQRDEYGDEQPEWLFED